MDASKFAGKTIEKVDAEAVNVVKFYFTDGTTLELEVEYFGFGLYGFTAEEGGV